MRARARVCSVTYQKSPDWVSTPRSILIEADGYKLQSDTCYWCDARRATNLKTAKEKSILRRTIDGTRTIGFSSSRSIHFCNKKNSTIFDLTTAPAPYESTPILHCVRFCSTLDHDPTRRPGF